MKIASADVIVCSPGRNFVTLKLTTDDGIVGYGDATVNGRELAVVGYLREHLCPLLVGRDATRINDTWQYLYRGAYWRRGPITMASISAVDQALWDVNGKALGVPVYRLLGGQARDYLLTYPHCVGQTVEATVEAAAAKLDEGYQAIRVQAAVPGLATTYGVHVSKHGEDAAYEPAAGSLPEEEEWDTGRYLDFVPKLIKAVRDELGYGFALLHDSHHRLTPIEAGGLGKALEPYRMFWLEDTTPAEDQTAFRTIRAHTTTPLAVGEVFNTVWDFQTLITERLIDYVRMPVTHGGGISHLMRVLALADVYGVRSGAHGPSDISPVGMAANAHVGWVIPNFGIQEFMGYPELTGEVFKPSYELTNGLLRVSDAPGLGVEVDEEAAARYPYVARYLPVNRRQDGSMHDW